MLEKRNGLLEKANSEIASIEKAAFENDLNGYNRLVKQVNETLKEVNILQKNIFYADLLQEDNPVKSAIEKLQYETYRLKINRNKGEFESASIETRNKTIDLGEFCIKANLKANWSQLTSKLAKILCLYHSKATEVADIAKIDTMYHLREFIGKSLIDEVPTSNRQWVKLLQDTIDAIYYEDMNGKNRLKVHNADVEYLLKASTGKDNRTVLALKDSGFRKVREIVTEIAHKILMGRRYTMVYKMTQEEGSNAKPEAPVVDAPVDTAPEA